MCFGHVQTLPDSHAYLENRSSPRSTETQVLANHPEPDTHAADYALSGSRLLLSQMPTKTFPITRC
jgi:hypothetical protein